MARALKPGAPLAFTYHHNRQEAYAAAGVAILDARLACTASLPCPAEMGGSIHIHGTGSSVVDTVFICRNTGRKRRRWLFEDAAGLAAIIEEDLAQLRTTGLKPSSGDLRCIVYGHLTRMAVWRLRQTWQTEQTTQAKLDAFISAMNGLGQLADVMAMLGTRVPEPEPRIGLFEHARPYEGPEHAVPF
jgi:hypothetical protein